MDQQEKEEVINKWLKGNLDDAELATLLSEDEVAEYKKILSTVENWEPEGIGDVEINLNDILSQKEEAKVVSMFSRNRLIGLAASVVLVLGVCLYLFLPRTQVFVAELENLELLLPDESTTVILAPGSKLTYKSFDSEDRKVTLSGLAYFDVIEKGPFAVEFEKGVLNVLGTRFAIDESMEEIVASCYSGKVMVDVGGATIELNKGDQGRLLETGWKTEEIKEESPLWVAGERRSFNNEPLTKVLDVLKNRYDVNFNTEEVSLDRRISTTIPFNNLEQACKLIFTPLNISHSITGKEVVLSE